MNKNKILLVTGHPRCGSKSISNFLVNSGLDTPHELMGINGIVSWWHANSVVIQNGAKYLVDKASKKKYPIRFIVQYIRNPIDAIPSIILENEFNNRENNSFKYRRLVIKRKFGVDLLKMDKINAAASSFVYWNRFVNSLGCSILVRIENCYNDFKPIDNILNVNLHNKVLSLNSSDKKFQEKKIDNFSLDSLNLIDDKYIAMSIENILNLYYKNDSLA